MVRPFPPLPAASIRVVVLLAAGLLAGCQSDDEVKPSPIPANALAGASRSGASPSVDPDFARGTRLDRLLAVVEGRPLSMRMMIRRLGIDPADIEDPDNQQEIERETRAWAKEQLYEKAAERIGLRLQAQKVDDFVAERLQQKLDEAAEEIGRPVTRAEYLESEGIRWSEFREQQRGLLMRQLYLQKMLTGIGSGTRPQVDLAVSPAEVRRIYADHRKLFDEQAGVRLAQFRVEYEQFEDGKRDDLEVEDATMAEARRLGEDLRRGLTPEALAKKYDLGESGERWAAAKADQFVTTSPDPAVTTWMLASSRAAGDYQLLPTPTGMQVLGILEIRAARRVPFQEAYPTIVKELTFARQAQLESTTLIDLLSTGRVVWPEELADELVMEAREVLDKIQSLDHLRGARLR